MKITAELTQELAKYGFKFFKIAGITHFTNSDIKEGIEIKSNHIYPYVIDSTGKNYSPAKLHEDTELCITIIENMNEMVHHHDVEEPGAKPAEQQTNVTPYIPETAIVPQNLTNELIAKHPGTIPCLISMQQTNPSEIQTRPGPKGTVLTYVSGDYMQRCLNFAALFDWDFEVLESREDLIGDKTHFSVFGKLTIKTTEGKTISKTQWGSQILKIGQEVGDALKGASTDSLKKCASMLGIARDVYGGEV